MGQRNFTGAQKILDAKAATGIGNVINVEDFRHLVLAIDTASSANMTIKLQGSIQDTQPTFTSAQSATNQWDYIQVKDLEDGSTIDGDTGLVLAGTDDHRIFEINVNGLKWITLNITARSAGSATAIVKGFNN